MGSLEARGVAEGDRASFWQAVIVDLFLVAPHGGIRPAQRRRSRLALTPAEREVISRGTTAHQSARSMAKLLGRSPLTISRMISGNNGNRLREAPVSRGRIYAYVMPTS
jgi:DNA-binding CsgD family transcriptional regulator